MSNYEFPVEFEDGDTEFFSMVSQALSSFLAKLRGLQLNFKLITGYKIATLHWLMITYLHTCQKSFDHFGHYKVKFISTETF